MKVRETINNGTIYEVKNIKIRLNLLESIKNFIPEKVFSVKIEEICSVQQGVFVEKILRIPIKNKGKKESIYCFSLLSYKLKIVPIMANILQGRNVAGIFQK